MIPVVINVQALEELSRKSQPLIIVCSVLLFLVETIGDLVDKIILRTYFLAHNESGISQLIYIFHNNTTVKGLDIIHGLYDVGYSFATPFAGKLIGWFCGFFLSYIMFLVMVLAVLGVPVLFLRALPEKIGSVLAISYVTFYLGSLIYVIVKVW
ncbi:hypothetical protein [Acinetobacter sp. YH12153]|uniref:hypothetical protein n=1 Tax=Acinetobacter sp. YH12153 TaxID=2601133 RepID=UPI0015D2BEC4|nr:hypothetical protein [Acinetobacter sp. YH12153]